METEDRREKNRKGRVIPPGQCHRSCNGRIRASPWGEQQGGGGPVLQKQMKRTFFLLLFLMDAKPVSVCVFLI